MYSVGTELEEIGCLCLGRGGLSYSWAVNELGRADDTIFAFRLGAHQMSGPTPSREDGNDFRSHGAHPTFMLTT